MKNQLSNPVYYSLISGDKHLGYGTEKVRFFDDKVSPFAGFEEDYPYGFSELYELLPPGRVILFATPKHIKEPNGWQLLQKVDGLQFIFDKEGSTSSPLTDIHTLNEQHVEQMIGLTALTKPGPFSPRTIDFGHYYGIFDKERLVAMAGQRMHVQHFTEISAVCTHPDYLGKGYAASLLQHQIRLIRQHGQTPFLHVRADNDRAIHLYHRIGFKINGPMNFYALKRS